MCKFLLVILRARCPKPSDVSAAAQKLLVEMRALGAREGEQQEEDGEFGSRREVAEVEAFIESLQGQ